MRILNKYILKSLVMPIILSLFVLSGLVWLINILRLLFLFEKNVNLSEFLMLSSLILPFLFHTILPFATLYSVLYAYNSFKVNKELVIWEITGIKKRDLIRPAVILCFVITILALINSAFIMPITYNKLRDRLYELQGTFTTMFTQEGRFNDISKNLVLFVSNKISPNEFKGLILFDSRNEKYPAVYLAEKGSATFSKNNINLQLEKGKWQTYGINVPHQSMSFNKFNINTIPSNLKKRELKDKNFMELFLYDLLFLNDKNTQDNKFVTEGHNRIVWPLFNLFLPIVALSAFICSGFNRKNYTIYLISSTALAVSFLLIHFMILSFASNNFISNIFLYFNLLVASLVSSFFINTKSNFG